MRILFSIIITNMEQSIFVLARLHVSYRIAGYYHISGSLMDSWNFAAACRKACTSVKVFHCGSERTAELSKQRGKEIPKFVKANSAGTDRRQPVQSTRRRSIESSADASRPLRSSGKGKSCRVTGRNKDFTNEKLAAEHAAVIQQ